MKTCTQCSRRFEWSTEDAAFLEKLTPTVAGQRLTLPEPDRCDVCRRIQRYLFRNDRNLYKRKCTKTGRDIVSIYSSEKPFPVYAIDVWYTDMYDPLQYGRDFDFSRPFFEQLLELAKEVPRPASAVVASENCDYTAFTLQSRNCFLTSRLMESEDIYYSYLAINSRNCMDIYDLNGCELCYECVDCKNSYHCFFGMNLENCTDCLFSRDLIGCSNCFGSINLRNKQYCYFNEQLSKEEYESRIKALNLASYNNLQTVLAQTNAFFLRHPRRALDLKASENVTGDHIKFSKNCADSYDVSSCQDCRYVSHFINSKDCMDWDYCGDKSEMGYENSGCVDLKFSAFVTNAWVGNSYLYYCDLLTNSKYCFGCIGLDKAEYCILNKQYTKEEYETLVPQIVEHMQKTGEWGEFFPASLSPYAYNETVAQDYLPLTEEEAQVRGLRWKRTEEKTAYHGPKVLLPDSVFDTDESMCKQILTCEASDENYRIIVQELAYHKQHGLALPRRSPNQRFLDRVRSRNPRHQWLRACANCKKEVSTSYAPDRLEIVYCEDCYIKTIY